MDLHNPSVRGHALLETDPVQDLHAVPKRYVDLRTAGGIFITDIVPTGAGLVGLKEYLTGTIPADYYLSKAVTNTANITVEFIAEPNVQENSVSVIVEDSQGPVAVPITNITADSNNPRLYTGTMDIVVDDQITDDTIRITSSTGTEFSVDLDILIGGPPVSSVSLGSYPAGQTEVKQGDTLTLTGIVRNDAVDIRILNFGASGEQKALTLGVEDSGGPGLRTFNGSFVVSNRSGDLSVRVVATNLLGTDGDPFTSADSVILNQTYPSFGSFNPTYPAGQQAVKGNEQMTFSLPINNADEAVYTMSQGLSITDPNVLDANKTVTRASDTVQYNVSTDNMSITATRTANGAVTTADYVIQIANVAPTADIVIIGGTTLRSSASGEDYDVEIRADQELLAQPSALVVQADTGTLSGSWQRINDTRYRTTITVDDGDTKGTHSFSGMVITGLAGIQGNVISSGENYTLAGITLRDLTVPALQQIVPIGTAVANINNVQVSYKGADVLTLRNDTTQFEKGFTITDNSGNYDVNGDHVFITDAVFAGANTSGTLILEFEETV